MRVAISTDTGYVSAHFGRCPEFTIVDIKENEVVRKEVVKNPGHAPGVIPQFLHDRGVEYIICGGMGTRAKSFFEDFGVQTIVGVEGKVDNVIEEILKGTLKGKESLCEHGKTKGYGVGRGECDHHHE